MMTNHPNSSKPAYSIGEVAEILGLHRATVSGFVNSGELRAARLGHRTVRISHEALMDFLRTKEEETRQQLEGRRGGKRRRRGSQG